MVVSDSNNKLRDELECAMTEVKDEFLFSQNEKGLIQALVENSILSQNAAQKLALIIDSGKADQTVLQLILDLGLASENEILQFLSRNQGLRILARDQYPSELIAANSFNSSFLREHHLIVLSENEKLIEICINDPFNPVLNSAISFAIGQRFLKVRLGYKKDISDALDLVLQHKSDSLSADKFDFNEAVLLEKDIRQLKELASEAPVIKIVNSAIKESIQNNASDIHIEPQNNGLKVRNRIDGVLVTVREIPLRLAAAIVSRIKILANLDIAQRRIPQDGRFDMNIDGQDIDIRVSVIPTIHGESIVLRLLYKKNISFDFDSLGYSTENKNRIMQMLGKPHGLILVTGPTGSGKSTTLYAMLQQINTTEKKIMSVEDPVEYKIEGINQIQVNAEVGVSFSSALKAIVRHDPEVIMVGEMRDAETAEIGIRASMTGHLILTTLHTNSAVSSIERLLDLGVEKSFVFSSMVGVVAQRLVRRLCDHCKAPISSEHIIVDSWEVEEADESMDCYQAVGCEHCNHTGYRGRLSICEVMLMNDDFRADAIAGNDSIHHLARKYGMTSMVVDGFEKIKSGQTSVEELFRMIVE